MDINELKKDVEAFGKGVERLEQLKAQFDKINTSGHKDEAKEIESMLKNVSAIPELEFKIARLKKSAYRGNGFKYKFKRALPKKSLVDTVRAIKAEMMQQGKNFKTKKINNGYKKVKIKEKGNESKNFLKCQNLSSRLEKVILNKDKLRARELYLESRDVYCKLGYLEKKKIYYQLMNLYNKLSKLYRER